MKREPNPYANNPILTVTNTMSISVPSMVVEDVLDGSADKITGVDPAVLEEIKEDIKAISSEMDSTSRLAYGLQGMRSKGGELYVDTKDDSGLVYLRVSGNGSHVEVTVDDLQNLANGGVGGSGSSDIILGHPLKKLGFSGDWNSEVISIAGNFNEVGTGLQYYALAAPAFANVEKPMCQLKVDTSGLLYTTDGGNTWLALGGSSDSSSGSSSDSIIKFYYNDARRCLNYSDSESEGENSGYAFLNTGSDGVTKCVYPIITPSIINASNSDYRLGWVWQGSDIFELKHTTDGGNTWLALGGSSDSSSGSSSDSTGRSYLPVSGDAAGGVGLTTTMQNATTYCEGRGYTASVLSFSVPGTGIIYGLQTSLAAMGIHGTPGKSITSAGAVQMALVQGASYSSEPYFVWWNNHNTWCKWEPWKNSGSSSSGSNTDSDTGNIDSEVKLTFDRIIGASGVQEAEESINITDLEYTITPRSANTNWVVTIAAQGLKCPYDANTAVFWKKTANSYKLQLTEDGGSTWTDLGGGGVTNIVTSTSSEVSFIPCNGDYSKLVIDASTESIQLDAARPDGTYRNDIGLRYGLKTSLASFNDDGVKLRLSHRTSGGTVMPVLQVTKGYNADWEDFVISSDSNTGGSDSTSSSENCVNFDTNNLGAVTIAKYSDYLMLATAEPSSNPIDRTGLVYYSLYAPSFYCGGYGNGDFEFRVVEVSNDVPGLQIRKRTGDWVTITGDNNSSSGGSNVTVTTTTSGVSFVPGDEDYKKLIIDHRSGNQINFLLQNNDGDKTYDTGLSYGLQVALAAFDEPSVRLRLSGASGTPVLQAQKGDGYAWEDFAIGSSSGSVSTLSGFAGTFKDCDSSCLDYKLGLDLDPSTQQAYLIVKNGEHNDWEPLAVGAGASNGSSDAIYELNERIDAVSEVIALMDSGTSSGTTATTGELLIPNRDSFFSDDPCAMQIQYYDSRSIVIDLYSKDLNFDVDGKIALNCGLANKEPYNATIMTVHGMGKLLFQHSGSEQVFDLAGTSSDSTNGELTIYYDHPHGMRTEGSLSAFMTYDTGFNTGDSIVLELRAKNNSGDTELSKSQIVLNAAIAAISEGGYLSKALRMCHDTEIDCVKWQLRSTDSPYDWSDAPIAATVLLSDRRYHGSSGYEPLTVSIHADGWLNVENRVKSKSHTIPFEDLAWLCDNIDKLKALVE